MNASDIKALRNAGNSNWEILHMVVDAGYEFPDASFKVSQALNMDYEEVAEMIDGYDNNC